MTKIPQNHEILEIIVTMINPLTGMETPPDILLRMVEVSHSETETPYRHCYQVKEFSTHPYAAEKNLLKLDPNKLPMTEAVLRIDPEGNISWTEKWVAEMFLLQSVHFPGDDIEEMSARTVGHEI